MDRVLAWIDERESEAYFAGLVKHWTTQAKSAGAAASPVGEEDDTDDTGDADDMDDDQPIDLTGSAAASSTPLTPKELERRAPGRP